MKLLGLICLLCVSVYAIKDNTLKANKTPKNAPRFVASCDKCVDYVNTVIKNLQDPAKIALIKEEIENVFCPRVAHPYECRLIASKLDLFIKELLPYLKSDEICKYLRFCNNKRLTQFHTVGQYFAEHFLSKLEGPKDLLCEECQFGIHELQEVVDDADTQKQIRTFISQNVCSRLGQYRGSCDIFVDDFLPDLFQELHNALQNPKQFCVNIQLCPSSMIVGKPKVGKRIVKALLE